MVGVIALAYLVKFVLTVLGKIWDAVVEKIGDYVIFPLGRQFTYLCCFDSNIKELEMQLEELQMTKQGVQLGVDNDHIQVRVIGPNVEAWLKRANDLTSEVGEIIKEKPKVKEGCLKGWCPNLKLRYSLSKKAVKKTEAVIKLQAVGVLYTKSSYNPIPTSMKTIPNTEFMAFESRRLDMENIVKALTNDKINLIGICGLPGVGKTAMAKEVAKQAKEDGFFVEVAWAVVSQKPNITHIQACIADMLGLKQLLDRPSPVVRADLLRERLLQDNKKILVILDDVWAELDLQDMGIPLGGANKNFKMLYTSRNRDLWHGLQTKKEIPLELLSKDEAWQLFREKAGNSADTWDLKDIAKQIANECGRLPLALVLIGSALLKKSGRNATKEIWENMLDRLNCASNTLVDNRLSSSLELSYKYVEDEEAKHMFLLCCLFKEDKDIRIEDLARYALGLSIFGGMNEMGKARRQVIAIVEDLKSRYLLLESGKYECVKVHDVVREMGISIASSDKGALVSHGAVSDWPKKDTYERYTSISVISRKITKLPEGLTCPNLEFLLLECSKLQELPCNFFKGMEKLKVLELTNFYGILKNQSLRNLTNLTMLSLEGFCGMLNVSVIGDLLNLEILSLRGSWIEELPEEIGELVNLRLLDLSGTRSMTRIAPGVISRLVSLEELYLMDSKFMDWEGEAKEKEGRNANLGEFESLSKLNTLEICIRNGVLIPEVKVFRKLKTYVILIGNQDYMANFVRSRYSIFSASKKCEKSLGFFGSIPIPSDRERIDSLLSSNSILLYGEGCNDLVRELLLQVRADGLQQAKVLFISRCNANSMNSVQLPTPIVPAPVIFPILEVLYINKLGNSKEMCSGPVPTGSFGELTSMQLQNCGALENLFQLPIGGCLPQLKKLVIKNCDVMKEIFIWKEQREDVHAATNRIGFPKLARLELEKLPSLRGFCGGIDQINFPQLKELKLRDLRRVSSLFHNDSNLSSSSEQNDNAGFLSLFPHKVSLPNGEVLKLSNPDNREILEHGPLSVGSLSLLREFSVYGCCKLLSVFPSQLLPMLRDLEKLFVKSCNLLEVVFESEGVDSSGPNPDILSSLKLVELHKLPKLNYISKRDPISFNYIETLDIDHCDMLRYVFSPTMMKSFQKLRRLKISKCEMLSRIVAEENGLGERSVEEVEFPELKELELHDLRNLVSFFPDANNPLQPQALFNAKVSVPNLTVVKVTELKNLERLGHGLLSVGSLSKLNKFLVRGCGKLLCVFPSQLLPMLRDLQKLRVQRCNSLEVVFELEGVESNEPNPEILSRLEVVKLHTLPKLKYISKRGHLGFKYIQTLVIYDCKSLEYIFAPTMTKSIPQLRRLTLHGCKMLSSIIAEENGLGESSVDEVEFPKLDHLFLFDLPNLVSFFPKVNTLAKSTDHLHSPMQCQPLFNKKVAIPSLENLRVGGLQNVSDLWCSELPTCSFSKVKELKVRGCASLRNMFHPSMAGRLVNLRKLAIKDCSKLEAVVDWEEVEVGQGGKIDKTLFPQLIELELCRVPILRRFCHFTHPIELPLVSKMDILNCPSMDAFSLGQVSTPNLSFPGISWNGDLNKAITLLQERNWHRMGNGSYVMKKRKREDEDMDIEEDGDDEDEDRANDEDEDVDKDKNEDRNDGHMHEDKEDL